MYVENTRGSDKANNLISANELFQKSLNKNKYPKTFGMSNRSFLYACRNNFGSTYEGIDKLKLLKAIESGEVWNIKGVGKKTIKEWCEWIAGNF